MINKHYFGFTLLLYITCVESKYQGDKCLHTRSGGNGTCKIFQDCMSALHDFRSNRPPETCGFEGTTHIVCCPESSGQTSTTTKRQTVVSPTSGWNATTNSFYGPPDGIVGRRSYEKCREYAQYVNVSYKLPGFQTVRYMNTCGFKAVRLIVSGVKAKPREFPHMAAVGYDEGNNKVYLCGGSLISDRFVLTAASCLITINYGKAKYVRLGELILEDDTDDASPQDFDVIQTISHPQYQPPSRYNDIGLLKLHAPATFNAWVRPTCLAIHRNSPTQRAIATGWGYTDFKGNRSNHLLKASLDLFNFSECNGSYAANNRQLKTGLDDNSQMCAGSREDRKDTCQGDGGGPLMIYHEDIPDAYCMYIQIGVTSFGKNCGTKIPAVYTRVNHYLGWIEDTVWP